MLLGLCVERVGGDADVGLDVGLDGGVADAAELGDDVVVGGAELGGDGYV